MPEKFLKIFCCISISSYRLEQIRDSRTKSVSKHSFWETCNQDIANGFRELLRWHVYAGTLLYLHKNLAFKYLRNTKRLPIMQAGTQLESMATVYITGEEICHNILYNAACRESYIELTVAGYRCSWSRSCNRMYIYIYIFCCLINGADASDLSTCMHIACPL